MSQWETLKLGRVAAGVGVSLLVDALGDLSGRSLPFRAADVAQPEILAGLISRGALTQVTPTVSIKEVKRQEIPSVSSNCHNLVLTIEQQGESALPDSLFVKLPMESLATRVFMNVIRSWRLESHFFRHVASGLPLRTPIT